ncbi:hypothetical protein D3C86_1991880 [compost metagenome]
MLQQLPADDGNVMGRGIMIRSGQAVTVGKMRVLQAKLLRFTVHHVDKRTL